MQLLESDMPYLYKPSLITEEIINDKEYYKTVFFIDKDYFIPKDLVFKFTDYCF